MSDDVLTPPPGAVHDPAERAVEFVRVAVNVVLDYTAETLPVLDHYLTTVPKDRKETVELIGVCAGCYFGEVVRRTLGGEWDLGTFQEPEEFRLILPNEVRVSPVGLAMEAITHDDTEGLGDTEVAAPDRDGVEDALGAQGEVPEDEYFSLSGRLEVLERIADVVAAQRMERLRLLEEGKPAPEDE